MKPGTEKKYSELPIKKKQPERTSQPWLRTAHPLLKSVNMIDFGKSTTATARDDWHSKGDQENGNMELSSSLTSVIP